MKTKHVAAAALLCFLLGSVGGGAYAYVTNPANGGAGHSSLGEKLTHIEEDREVAAFIQEQEELRPDGMSEARIATGSRYTGITYNHAGSTDNSGGNGGEGAEAVDGQTPQSAEATGEKATGLRGLLKRLTGGAAQETPSTAEPSEATQPPANTAATTAEPPAAATPPANTTATPVTPAEPAAASTQGRIKLQSGSLNVRAQGSLEGSVLGQVYNGDVVQILDASGAWYHILTPGGQEGYVSATYVEVINP